MKLILATLVIAALGVYIYIDYDNVKYWVTGQEPAGIVEKIEEPEYSPPKEIKKAEIAQAQTKFEVGDVVYINASAGDHIVWKQNMVPLWRTYNGSENEDYQSVISEVPHRLQVRITKHAIGLEEITWYHIRTAKGLPCSGWVKEMYLSEKLPKRRAGKNDEDWGI